MSAYSNSAYASDFEDDEPRRWTGDHPDGGRIDKDGVEWFACDPYPTWFRWENGELIVPEVYEDLFDEDPEIDPWD